MFAPSKATPAIAISAAVALSIGLACLAVAQTPSAGYGPVPATTSLAPAATPAYSAPPRANPRQPPLRRAVPPPPCRCRTPVVRRGIKRLNRSGPHGHSHSFRHAIFSVRRFRHLNRRHAVHASFEHAHADCEGEQRQRHLAQRPWPDLARVRHQPLPLRVTSTESAGTSDRRLDSPRDWLRSLALRAAGDSRRGSSHLARLSHA